MKTITIVIFWSLSWNLFGQAGWEVKSSIERNNFYLLEGTIDNKYPITMRLEYTWNYCGEGNNNKWKSRTISGWYQYDNLMQKIPLVGYNHTYPDNYIKLYVPQNVLDTLDGVTCEMNNYREVFLIPDANSIDSLQWKQQHEDNFHPVILRELHSFSWETNAFLTLYIRGLSILTLNLSEITDNKYIDKVDVEAANEINSNFYFIVRFGHLTSPGYFGSGQCGAGWEGWVGFIHINNSLEVEKSIFYKDQSCATLIDAEYSFDKARPELGITIKNH